MRTNLPVTQHEVMLRDNSMIVSKTDLKGRITYVNNDFLEISGFTEKELIGEPHNIVRHPDMPVEAFEDLWRTLKDGRPWVGYVKNRCKNGDHYWVEAHASPVWEGDQAVGYMSVRRKPSREKVEAAEKAYALFREKKQGNLIIKDGWVASKSPMGRAKQWLKDTSISTKLMLGVIIISMLLMSIGGLIASSHIKSTLEKQGIDELQKSLGLIRGMVEIRSVAMQREADRLVDVFASSFPEGFALEEGERPVLRHGKTEMYHRNTEVDQFSASSKAAVTIFARKGDDFVRYSTSLKNEKGERVTDTSLGMDHPARKRLLAGERSHGLVKLFGKDFYAVYVPIKERGGKVIGALFSGLDVSTELGDLKKHIRDIKVGQTGYFYVLDDRPGPDRGTLIVHPAKEGSNIFGAKDASGHEFIKEMHERQRGTIIYPWMNKELGDSSQRDKFVAFDTFTDWNWLIGGGTYLDEFYALTNAVNLYMGTTALIILLTLMAMIYWLVKRVIQGPLDDQILPAFKALSGGKYDNPVDAARHDEIGKVLQGLESMQNRLGFEVAEIKRQADEMTRIKIALDNVSTGVMIADTSRTIIYTNNAVQRILKSAEPDLRAVLPTFSADRLLGESIDQFHKNPKHQESLLANLSETYVANLNIGTRHMRVTASPVFNDRKERLGAVAEWLDRTQEIRVEREVESLVNAAAVGDLSQRIDLAGKEGFFIALSEGLNKLVATTEEALKATSEVLGRLAQGDLTRTVEIELEGMFGQLKDDTNSTIERLRDAVGKIQESTEHINTAATEIAAGNQDLSSRTEEQASSLEETSSSMEQLNSTVKQNADNARMANDLAIGSNDAAVRGGEMVKAVVETMSGIQDSSKRIADIIGVIDGIAFQTNILALNAAVEAARAGEQGRGFAVVATEVRNLAQRSATAAKEIKQLISESVEQVDRGVKLVDDAGKTINSVVESFSKVAHLVTDITNASREQSTGIDQVTLAVSQMDEVTQQNAALVEEAAAAAESLEEQARSLADAVSMFKLEEQRGEKARQLPPPAKKLPPPPKAEGTKAANRAPRAALPSSLDDEWSEF